MYKNINMIYNIEFINKISLCFIIINNSGRTCDKINWPRPINNENKKIINRRK